MLTSMQTIDVYELVSASFEACGAFVTPGDGSPVCAGCGWLEPEHRAEPTEVHTLQPRRRTHQPERLAS